MFNYLLLRMPIAKLSKKTLPLVAQALALRNQYQPLSIMHTPIPQGYVLPKVTQQDEEFWSENRIGAYEKRHGI